MKRFLILLLLISPVQWSLAQTGSLKGSITEAETGDALPGAAVIWIDNGRVIKGDVTDKNGHFRIDNIETGKQQFRISFLGYETIRKTVNIDSAHSTEVNISLQFSTMDLSAIEIVGTHPHAIKSIPGAATKIEPKTVSLIKPIGTQEILQYVPGVYGFADDGMGNSRISVGIRGLNPRRSAKVLVLEDGIPIQPAIYVYPNMYYNPPVERLDEVEVIKGSAAIKHGPQTMGGVINYITRRPQSDFSGQVQLTGGENNYRSVFAAIGGFGNEKVQPEIQMLYKSSDGFRQNNHFDQFNGTVKLKLLPNDHSDIYIKGNVNYENSNATYTGLTEYSFAANPRFNPKEDDNFKVLRTSLDVIRNKYISENLISTTKVYMSYFDRRWWREFDIFVRAEDFEDEDGNFTPVPWYTDGNLVRIGGGDKNFGILRTFYTLGAEHSYDYEHKLFGLKGNLEVGARGHWERFIDDMKIGDAPDAREGVYYTGHPDSNNVEIVGQSHHYETTAFSAYLMEKLYVNKNFILSPGVRFEGFEQERIDRLQGSIYQDKTTLVLLPGIGFNYELKKVNLFGGVHRGFTPPSSGTLKILSFGAIANDSLDLNAEKSWNYELGLRGNSKALSFEVTGFYLDIQDLVAAGRGTAFKNLGAARTYGVENMFHLHLADVSKKLKYLPDFHVVYTYMQTEIMEGVIQSALQQGDIDVTGNELPYAPHHSLLAGISKFFDFGLQLRADVQYTSEVFSDFENIRRTSNRGDQGPVPSYYIINASVKYDINESWSLFATGKNILDNVYIGSRLHSNPGQPEAWLSSGILPGPRRQINGGVKFKF